MSNKHKKKFSSPQKKPEPASNISQPLPSQPVVRALSPQPAYIRWAPWMIVAIGSLAFITGITGQFLADDAAQITQNPVTQSLSNIGRFFSGSTYYNGAVLVGNYYRPIMTTVWSALYSIFGASSVPFHVVQLALYILSVVLLFLVFKYSFKPLLALGLSLIFLVHPINSQAVFSISALQDILFFLFGMLAWWVLLRYRSTKSMFIVAGCLLLSLLSKETGILFVFVTLLYLFLFDRSRLLRFAGIVAAPVSIYIILKLHAVGLSTAPHAAPIDEIGLGGRLATAPSILMFYVLTFLWPVHLASRYYWIYPNVSFTHFVLPLVVVAAVIALAVRGDRLVRHHLRHSDHLTYLFFAAWAAAGLAIHLQIIPLDMTACTNWFIFPMVGVLGMIGETIKALSKRYDRWGQQSVAVVAILIFVLAVGSFLRGFDWKSQEILAARDVAAAPIGNAAAYTNLADQSYKNGDYQQTKVYALQSIAVAPGYAAYNDLGYARLKLGDYPGSLDALQKGLKYYPHENIYIGIAELTTVYGSYDADLPLLNDALKHYPKDSTIWMCMAILQIHHHDHEAAMTAAAQATQYGQISPAVLNAIANKQPFNIDYGPQPVEVQ